jgi:Amt family ammonium transporter
MLGAASGAVAGLVAITPACGFVGPMGAIVIGLVSAAGLPVGRQWPQAHAGR